jgi:hypothetical protein
LNTQTNRDIGVLPLFGDRKPFLLFHSAANEVHGQISPGGAWIAYESDESGQNDVSPADAHFACQYAERIGALSRGHAHTRDRCRGVFSDR